MTTLRLDPYQETAGAGRRFRQKPLGGPVWYRNENKDHLDEEIEKLVLRLVEPTTKLKRLNVTDLITSGEIEQTMDGASTVRFTLHDPESELLRTGAFNRAIDIQLDGLWFRLVVVEKQGSFLTLIFEDRIVAYLRAHKKVRRASRADLTRLEFCLWLVRSVKAQPIRCVIPELLKKQKIEPLSDADLETMKEAMDPNTVQGLIKGKEIKVWHKEPGKQKSKKRTTTTVFQVHYADATVKKASKTQIKHMETIIDMGREHRMPDKLIVAALATAMIETGVRNKSQAESDSDSQGVFQQRPSQGWPNTRDTGTQALAFYRAAKKIWKANRNIAPGELAAQVQRPRADLRYKYGKAVPYARDVLNAYQGETILTRPYRKRYMFTTEDNGKAQNYWDAIGRLLEETQFARFVSNGILYMISEPQLFRMKPRMKLSEETEGVHWIDFTWDTGQSLADATVQCRISRWHAPPGTTVKLEELGPADGRWLVRTIRRNIFSKDATITLAKPRPFLPEPPPEIGTRQVSEGADPKSFKGKLTTSGGAKGIADQLLEIAIQAGGTGVYAGSTFRANDYLPSGQPSDHSQLGANGRTRDPKYRYAHDIGVRGINLITGPPSPKLDKAVRAIGAALGVNYKSGKEGPFQNAHNINWRGYRIQIIWRTTGWGGHMGHIHVGVRKI